MKNPFELSEIEDCIIIIKAKGKHYGIVPKNKKDKEIANAIRAIAAITLLDTHCIVEPALEDIKKDKLV